MTESEFLHLALHSYSNKQCCTVEEFNSDISRINTIRRLLKNYAQDDKYSHRVVLNHCTIVFNVFGKSAYDMLMYKIDDDLKPLLLPYINTLNRLPLPIGMMGIEYNKEVQKELEEL